MTDLDPKSTALVLIDLQNGIIGMPLAPRSGQEVLAAGKSLAQLFRAAGAQVVLVNVAFARDFADAPTPLVDRPTPRPEGGLPDAWSELAEGLAQAGDIRITKRQWGAFYGTELDLQLSRRGIRTIVLGGIATNFGVESTARQAWERGYNVILVEPACASASAELHEMTIEHVLPRIARVLRSTKIGFLPG